MLSKLRSILAISFSLTVWGMSNEVAKAQFGGIEIQIGRGPYGGSGLYIGGSGVGGFGAPFGVGPSIPQSSRAYMGPQSHPGYQYHPGYQSGYRGYYGYGAQPSLGIYGSPLDYPRSSYRGYELQVQQYQLQRQQMELQAAQQRLSAPQVYPYDARPRYSAQSPRASSSTTDLRPGMVLPDGSTVISVGPISPNASTPTVSGSAPSDSPQPTVAPNILPSGIAKPSRASF